MIDVSTGAGALNEKSDSEKTAADEENNSKNNNQSPNPNEQCYAKVKHCVLSPEDLVLDVIYEPDRKLAMVVDILQIQML